MRVCVGLHKSSKSLLEAQAGLIALKQTLIAEGYGPPKQEDAEDDNGDEDGDQYMGYINVMSVEDARIKLNGGDDITMDMLASFDSTNTGNRSDIHTHMHAYIFHTRSFFYITS